MSDERVDCQDEIHRLQLQMERTHSQYAAFFAAERERLRHDAAFLAWAGEPPAGVERAAHVESKLAELLAEHEPGRVRARWEGGDAPPAGSPAARGVAEFRRMIGGGT